MDNVKMREPCPCYVQAVNGSGFVPVMEEGKIGVLEYDTAVIGMESELLSYFGGREPGVIIFDAIGSLGKAGVPVQTARLADIIQLFLHETIDVVICVCYMCCCCCGDPVASKYYFDLTQKRDQIKQGVMNLVGDFRLN